MESSHDGSTSEEVTADSSAKERKVEEPTKKDKKEENDVQNNDETSKAKFSDFLQQQRKEQILKM